MEELKKKMEELRARNAGLEAECERLRSFEVYYNYSYEMRHGQQLVVLEEESAEIEE